MRATPAPDSHSRYVDNYCPFGFFDWTQISTSSPVWIKKQAVQTASGPTQVLARDSERGVHHAQVMPSQPTRVN